MAWVGEVDNGTPTGNFAESSSSWWVSWSPSDGNCWGSPLEILGEGQPLKSQRSPPLPMLVHLHPNKWINFDRCRQTDRQTKGYMVFFLVLWKFISCTESFLRCGNNIVVFVFLFLFAGWRNRMVYNCIVNRILYLKPLLYFTILHEFNDDWRLLCLLYCLETDRRWNHHSITIQYFMQCF